MKQQRIEVKNVRVVNTKDVDVVVRDCYGVEHLLFPNGEKELPVLTHRETAHDKRPTVFSS